ncbi:MAG: hypothetical protein U0Z53_24630 [Blastocatellia bacterium]
MRKFVILVPLIILCWPMSNKVAAQTNSFPKVIDSAPTILGEIQIIQLDDTKSEIRLNRRVILKINDQTGTKTGGQMYSENPLLPTSINDVIHQKITPYDEVVIFHNGNGTAHCGPGVAFLGLKKNGTYKFSRPTGWCTGGNEIKVQTDSIEIRSQADVHSSGCGYLPILGGRWVYKKGVLYTKKYVLLPDPVKNRKPCT